MSPTLLLRRASALLPPVLNLLIGRGARVSLGLLFCCFIFWQLSGTVAAETGEAMPKVLRAGFLLSAFSDMDASDAKAALEVQARRISSSLGYGSTAQVTLFRTLQSMSDVLHRGEFELVTMPSIEYLKLRKTTPLIPCFVASTNGGLGARYVIITHKDSGIRSFGDLRGRSMMLPSLAAHDLDQLWLDVLLLKNGKGARASFFSRVKESPRMFNSIMGVFLRQADAAVVTRSVLEASRQLNPQLAAQLTVVAESRYLSDGVTCLNPRSPEKFRNKLYQELLRLNETSAGRQMYTIFHVDGMRPFNAACLEGLEELVNEHERLKGLSGNRK